MCKSNFVKLPIVLMVDKEDGRCESAAIDSGEVRSSFFEDPADERVLIAEVGSINASCIEMVYPTAIENVSMIGRISGETSMIALSEEDVIKRIEQA